MAKKRKKLSVRETAARLEEAEVEQSKTLVWCRPVTRDTDVGTFVLWRTLCNRYLVARVDSRLLGEHRYNAYRIQKAKLYHAGMDDVAWNEAGRPEKYVDTEVPIQLDNVGRPKDYRSIERAFDVCLEDFSSKGGTQSDNRDEVMEHAMKHHLDRLPVVVDKGKTLLRGGGKTTTTRSSDMAFKLNRVAAVKMFQEMGMASADGWDNARLLKKIEGLPKFLEGEEVTLTTDESKDTLKRIKASLDEGVEIELPPEDGKEKKGKGGAKATPAKSAASNTKGKGKKKAGKGKDNPDAGGAKRDAFGSREGSQAAKANAVLSKKKPMSMADIVKAAGLADTVYNHMNSLVKAGHVKKTDKGYVLA